MTPTPHDRFLSCCLCDRDGGHRPFEVGLTGGVEAADFAGANRSVFEVLMRLYGDRVPFSTGAMETELGKIDEKLIGEGGTLHRLYSLQCVPQEAGYWTGLLRSASQIERFKFAALEILEISKADNDDPEEAIASAQKKLFSITQSTAASNCDIHAIGKAVIESWRSGEIAKMGIQWPIQKLQQSIGNITDELVIIAALPSVGKTALSLQMALRSSESGRIVSFLSLESSADKIAQRLIATITQIPTLPLRAGHSTRYDEALERWEKIKALPFRLRTGPHSADQIHAWAQAEKAAGSRLLILDNLKHVRITRKFNSRPEQFGWLSQEMKHVRDEVQLPFVVIHHMTDDDKLSWSSDIQRDFDIIVVMSAAEETKGQSSCRVEFEVRKNRDGHSGFTVGATFEKDVQTFREIA